MKVSKWGNSLAIRLPAELVEKLEIREGDELEAQPGMREGTVAIRRKRTKEELLAALAEIRKKVKEPEGFKFDRDEANSRGE